MRKPYTKGTLTVEEFLTCLSCTEEGCWNWKYSVDTKGYGNLRRNGKLLRAHRVSYMLHHAVELTPVDLVLHKCDNRLCCNPTHLYCGTAQDNTLDRVKRHRGHQGETHKFSKFSDHLITKIRTAYSNGYTQSEIAKKYNVEQSYVSRLVNNKARALQQGEKV